MAGPADDDVAPSDRPAEPMHVDDDDDDDDSDDDVASWYRLAAEPMRCDDVAPCDRLAEQVHPDKAAASSWDIRMQAEWVHNDDAAASCNRPAERMCGDGGAAPCDRLFELMCSDDDTASHGRAVEWMCNDDVTSCNRQAEQMHHDDVASRDRLVGVDGVIMQGGGGGCSSLVGQSMRAMLDADSASLAATSAANMDLQGCMRPRLNVSTTTSTLPCHPIRNWDWSNEAWNSPTTAAPAATITRLELNFFSEVLVDNTLNSNANTIHSGRNAICSNVNASNNGEINMNSDANALNSNRNASNSDEDYALDSNSFLNEERVENALNNNDFLNNQSWVRNALNSDNNSLNSDDLLYNEDQVENDLNSDNFLNDKNQAENALNSNKFFINEDQIENALSSGDFVNNDNQVENVLNINNFPEDKDRVDNATNSDSVQLKWCKESPKPAGDLATLATNYASKPSTGDGYVPILDWLSKEASPSGPPRKPVESLSQGLATLTANASKSNSSGDYVPILDWLSTEASPSGSPVKRVESSDTSDIMNDDDDGFKQEASDKALASKNLISERRRRKNFNERLYLLRSIVPKISKMDKASIVGDAITYALYLQKQVEAMEEDIKKLQLVKDSLAFEALPKNEEVNPVVDAKGSTSETHDHKVMEVVVSYVEEKTYLLQIHCKKGPGIMVQMTKALESLDFEIVNANLTSLGEHVFNSITIKVKNEKDVEATELRKVIVKIIPNFGLHLYHEKDHLK